MENEILKNCLECKKSFDEVERFESTNLCVDCFNRDITDGKEDMITIYEGEIIGVSILKNEFEKMGIKTFFKDEHMGVIAPSRVSSGGATPFKIMIDSKDADKAKEILNAYLKNNK